MNTTKLIFAAIGIIAALLFGGRGGSGFDADAGSKLAPGNHVVMYSLTTCGYCKQRRTQFQEAGIPFSEVFLDTNAAEQQEFQKMLVKRGVPPGRVGTPTLLVNGELLLNNPSIAEITKHLRFRS